MLLKNLSTNVVKSFFSVSILICFHYPFLHHSTQNNWWH